MLTVANKEDIDAYIALAWELAMDLTRSSFPTYLDGIKTKDEFYTIAYDSLDEEDEEILLYSEDGVVQGWIHYYWMDDQQYLSFRVFNIRQGTAQAIDEYLSFIRDRFAGYEIDFGFPVENAEALSHLAELGWKKLEEDDCFVLHFKDYDMLPESDNIVPVTEENYQAFRSLHDQHTDMYWNSERLLPALRGETKHPWFLYLYLEQDEALGCVYFTYVDGMMEIFGIDHKDGVFRADVMKKLLIRALNRAREDGQKDVTTFAEGRESDVLKELPFDRITTYVAYTNKK